MSAPLTRLLITGERGAGKTRLCRDLVEAVRSLPGPPVVGGVLSLRVYEGEEQVGIQVVDLRTGRRRRLASLRAAGEPAPSEATKLWRFHEDALKWGNDALTASLPCDLLVVDEIGPLELEEGRGWAAGLSAVDSGAFTAAVVVVRPRLLPVALSRWPDAEVVKAGEGIGPAERAGDLARRLFGSAPLR